MGHYSHSDIEEAVKSASTEGLEDYLYQEPKSSKKRKSRKHKNPVLTKNLATIKNRAALTKISHHKKSCRSHKNLATIKIRSHKNLAVIKIPVSQKSRTIKIRSHKNLAP